MPDGIHVDINGFEQLVGILHGLPAHIGQATMRANRSWAYRVLATSNSKYVPIKSGDLAASGGVVDLDPNESGTGESKVAIVYTKDYALDQHENENYKHPNGGQAHYLLQAVEDHKGELLREVAQELRTRVR